MLDFKKRIILEITVLLFLLAGAYILQHPYIIPSIFLIDSRAVQQSLALSVTIGGCEEESLEDSNADGIIELTSSCNKPILPKITNIPAKSNIKLRVYTNLSTPEGFTAPTLTEVAQVFKYINITLNTTLTGTATIFFNISQADLAGTDQDDIALFKYSTSWTEQTTTVLDSISDPISFSALVTSFSRFLIGTKPSAVVSAPVGAGGGISRGGAAFEVEKPTPPAPVIKLPEIIKKIIAKVAELPKEFVKYKINYKIIYIVTAALLILVISLEIMYYLINRK